MTTSIATFRNEFAEGVLDFTWRQWCRIGVLGSAEGKNPWVVDPEPVLAFTTEVARRDARMFDEVMDWLVTNGRWINVQRLSTVVGQDNVGDKAVVGAVAAWMAERDKSMKWRGLAQRNLTEIRTPAEPLFRSAPGQRIGAPGDADAFFLRYGLVRGTVRPRGRTLPVNLKDPVNILFKSRAVFGIGIRADVMAFLMTTEGAHARDMARVLGYNHMRVQEVLNGLSEAGVASVRAVGRAKTYSLDRDRWQGVLAERQAVAPRWVNWRALTRGLTGLWRQVQVLEEARADEYVFSSKMRAAMRSVRPDLLASGLGVVIEDDKGHVAEDYLPVFLRDVERLLKILAG